MREVEYKDFNFWFIMRSYFLSQDYSEGFRSISSLNDLVVSDCARLWALLDVMMDIAGDNCEGQRIEGCTSDQVLAPTASRASNLILQRIA